MRPIVAAVLALGALAAVLPAYAQVPLGGRRTVDAFDTVDGWSARPADGVEMRLSSDAGVEGNALRIDFRFVKGGGYAVVHRELSLDLPETYRFTFALRGQCLPNNLEFKLIDGSGDNVWWCNRRDFHFPSAWDTVVTRRRQIQFAWGPRGGGEIRHVAAIEFAIAAGSGGAGTVWLDELELTPVPSAGTARPPIAARASSSAGGHEAGLGADGDSSTAWWSRPDDGRPWLELDFQGEREFGGLVVDWMPGRHARDYAVEVSGDGTSWRTVREVREGNGGRDHLYLPESEARRVRFRALGDPPRGGCAVREVEVKPLEWAASPESFFHAVARESRRGSYPRGMSGEQVYWTVVGASDGDPQEGLLSEDGMLETGKASFSVEPFLRAGGRLVTWADVGTEQQLEGGYLPIPSVRWHHPDLELEVTAFAPRGHGAATLHLDREPGALDQACLVARYRVRNRSGRRLRATLFLALRPFQVNPPAQFLNTPGGTAPIRELVREGQVVRVNGDRGVVCLTPPSGFGAATFDQGDIVSFLDSGRLPPRARASDPLGYAWGALAYPLDLTPEGEREVDLLVPLHDRPEPPRPGFGVPDVKRAQEACAADWRSLLDRVAIRLPDRASDLELTLRAQLGWILVNRDGAAIQPGSRAYARSWIRDGSLTSSALLRMGLPEVVKDFIEWFAPYQYSDGKVPCCVDRRGSDPVPEHDSHGEFIFLVAEYFRYTDDRTLVRRMWPPVRAAADYLDSLRQQRRTAEWRAPGKKEFFGLLPPSISHEGYSAKPMHSYWDDFFALRGFKDAAYLAGVLDLPDEQARLARVGDEFQAELVASIRAAMKKHRIDWIPGCADLGDFDATSTTIALSPVQAQDVLPRKGLERTFEKYWEFFRDRRDGKLSWEAFTPYEMRNLGAFVRLGWRERADDLVEFFLGYRRPPGWRQWAEVVWHDERRPHFIGDLPHTWVGSDFVRSALDLLAWERERDESLVLGAGVPAAWVTAGPGVEVRNLPTRWGRVDFTLRGAGDSLEVRIAGGLRVPRGGVVVKAPRVDGSWTAAVNGDIVPVSSAGEVVVRALPARVALRP